MAVSLDDDVPLILTLEEGDSAPLAPSNGLGQEGPPNKSKLVGGAHRWAGLTACLLREGQTGGLQSQRGRRAGVAQTLLLGDRGCEAPPCSASGVQCPPPPQQPPLPTHLALSLLLGDLPTSFLVNENITCGSPPEGGRGAELLCHGSAASERGGGRALWCIIDQGFGVSFWESKPGTK